MIASFGSVDCAPAAARTNGRPGIGE